MKMHIPAVLACCGLLAACAQQPVQRDPLQNTRKLAVKGHTTLYNNGLFEVPMTTIHLIPAGPDAFSLATELGGVLPRQSVKESLQHARESMDLMNAGVKKSGEVAQQMKQGSDDTAHAIKAGSADAARDIRQGSADAARNLRQDSAAAARDIKEGADQAVQAIRPVTGFGVEMVKNAPAAGLGIAAASVTFAGESYDAFKGAAHAVSADSAAAGQALSAAASGASSRVWDATRGMAGDTAAGSRAAFGSSMAHARSYILAIAVVPEKLGQRYRDAVHKVSWSDFAQAASDTNGWRKEASGRMSTLLVQTGRNYVVEASAPFQNAGKEWDQAARDGGYNLAMLKYLGWSLQGIFWDATIKPAGKMAGAGLGYILVNGAAIPVLVTREAGNVLNVAVQVTWNSAAGAYDVTAPGAEAALSGLFGAVRLVGGHALAATEYAAGGVAAAGTYAAGKSAAGATWAGGKLASGVLYIGAPLSTAGIAAGGAAVGVVTGAGGVVGGAGIAAAGVAGEGITRVSGTASAAVVRAGGMVAAGAVRLGGAASEGLARLGGAATAGATTAGGTAAAGTVLLGGSVASIATGTALGAYELSRAVVAPVGYAVGSGLVLSYGTLSQLAAQGVYLAGDATYLVLSQEGPRWVLYAVTGNLHNGEKLPPGAVVDLEGMQQNGEHIVPVTVSEQQMQRVIEAVPDQLPTLPQGPGAQPTQAAAPAAQ